MKLVHQTLVTLIVASSLAGCNNVQTQTLSEGGEADGTAAKTEFTLTAKSETLVIYDSGKSCLASEKASLTMKGFKDGNYSQKISADVGVDNPLFEAKILDSNGLAALEVRYKVYGAGEEKISSTCVSSDAVDKPAFLICENWSIQDKQGLGKVVDLCSFDLKKYVAEITQVEPDEQKTDKEPASSDEDNSLKPTPSPGEVTTAFKLVTKRGIGPVYFKKAAVSTGDADAVYCIVTPGSFELAKAFEAPGSANANHYYVTLKSVIPVGSREGSKPSGDANLSKACGQTLNFYIHKNQVVQ